MNRLFVALLGALVAHAGLIMLPLVAFELEGSAAGVAHDVAPLDVVFFTLLAPESAVDEAVASHASGAVDEKPVRNVASQEVSIQESLIQEIPIQIPPKELASSIPASLPASASAPAPDSNSSPNRPLDSSTEPLSTAQLSSRDTSALSAHLAARLLPKGVNKGRSRWFERAPEYVYNPKPLYPRFSRRQRQEGDVLLDVLVGEKGATKEISVASSSGYELLDDAAVKAVAQWRFVPARHGDHPQTMWVKVPIEFRLQ